MPQSFFWTNDGLNVSLGQDYFSISIIFVIIKPTWGYQNNISITHNCGDHFLHSTNDNLSQWFQTNKMFKCLWFYDIQVLTGLCGTCHGIVLWNMNCSYAHAYFKHFVIPCCWHVQFLSDVVCLAAYKRSASLIHCLAIPLKFPFLNEKWHGVRL